jgi:two-component system, OmpR family, sensor kinase
MTEGERRARRRFGIVPRTLRWRLALSVALLIAISFAITFAAVYRGTGSSLSHQIDREIAGDSGAFSSMLAGTTLHTPAQVQAAAERYARDQPYTGSSTLLFALVPGVAPATNQPELFDLHAHPDTGETQGEQERENVSAAKLQNPAFGYSKLELPDVGHLRLLARRLKIPGGPTVIIGVGEPLAVVHSAQVGVAKAFILAGILVLICALLAAYLIGTRFSAPLRGMASVAARVDAGDLHPRIHEMRDPPEEIHVLAEAFNHMLDRLTEAFAAQRAFVADASHELRTPLTVIRGQLELLAAEPDPTRAEVRRVSTLVQGEITRVGRLVDDMLLLARSERAEFLQPRTLELRGYVSALWEATRPIAPRRFELGAIPSGTLRADPDRLAQALRNLLANAIEHTAEPDGLVRMSVTAIPAPAAADGVPPGGREEWLRFSVEDDGEGIPEDQRELVFGRFHRTDSARDRRSGGAGLGLAIVRAIAEAHGGSVSAAESPQGGARVTIEVPGFTPGRSGTTTAGRETPAAAQRAEEQAAGEGMLAGHA